MAALVTFAVAFGDLAATVLVLPPGAETLPVRIFRLIHAAAADEVAGMCLGLSAVYAAAAGAVGLIYWHVKPALCEKS
jgi:iron(III) transport system permease protein